MPQRAKVRRSWFLKYGISSGQPVRERVLAAVEEIRLEQARHVGRLHRAVGDAALRRLHFDQRLQPQHAARAVADDLDLAVALLGFGSDRLGDGIGAHRQRGGIAGNEDLDHARGSAIEVGDDVVEALLVDAAV